MGLLRCTDETSSPADPRPAAPEPAWAGLVEPDRCWRLPVAPSALLTPPYDATVARWLTETATVADLADLEAGQ
ncbi:hypothetical protein [Amycolatopsis taiwanensis]|uniref:Uncharacterized protein n=1 Tax=Amycolatopsis taiwanensis TaxID=342230 RepID=A0A9W6R8G0_9PSEU|nr:hypothetical protein [Amycolatopsis taiwanensis]GLY71269.1 hypothetical protein Atai01_78880 [Amycolatopsis taiwanensis]